MDLTTDILELKFEGNEINPTKVKPSEIGYLLENFEKALLSTIKRNHPEIDTQAVLFSFDTLKHESIGLYFKSELEVPVNIPNIKNKSVSVKDCVLESYYLITDSINNNDFKRLPNDTILSLKQIVKFSKTYHCTANFRLNGQSLTSLNGNAELKENKPVYLKGDTTLYGQIVDVGSNIHLKINDDYTVLIDVDKPTSKKLGSRIWETIGVKGNAEWDAETSKIIKFKFYDVLDYVEGKASQSFVELKKVSDGGWDKYNTDAEITKKLFRD